MRLRNFSGGETERWPSLSSGRAIGLRSSGVSAAARCCCRSAGFSSACACAWTAAAAAGCGGGAKCGGTPAAAAAAAAPAKPSRPPGGRPPTTAPWGSCCAWICCCDVKIKRKMFVTMNLSFLSCLSRFLFLLCSFHSKFIFIRTSVKSREPPLTGAIISITQVSSISDNI